MKKILVSIALIGGLAAASPVMAQRFHPGERAEYKYDRSGDRGGFDHERHGKRHDRMEGRRDGRRDGHFRDGGKHRKNFHGKKHGHCRKGAPGRGPRRGGR